MFLLYKLAGSLVVPPGCFIVAILIIAALAMRKPRKPFLQARSASSPPRCT